MQRICKIFVHQDIHVVPLQWRQHWQELLWTGFAAKVKPAFYFKVLSENKYSGCSVQISAVTHREKEWMLQHRELSAMWSRLILQEKHPMGIWCSCLSQCCHSNCFGNSYLLFNAGSWASSTELQACHPPKLSLRPTDLLALANAPLPLNSSWMSFWMINLKQNHSSGQLPFCLGSGERL